MKRLIVLALLGAAAVSGAASAAPVASTVQAARGDPSPLTRASFMARAEARFTRLDVDKDGQISREERRNARMGLRRARLMQDGPRADVGRGPGRGGPGAMLTRLDADNDGRVSRVEYDAGLAMMADRAAERGVSKEDFARRSAERFTRLDTNADGYVDAAERAAMPRPPRPPMSGQTPPPPPPPPPGA